jgi:hypothetical protein
MPWRDVDSCHVTGLSTRIWMPKIGGLVRTWACEDAADWASLSPGTRISDRSDDGNATDPIDLLPSISLS